MSARISLMYKRSGGCNTEHKCSECSHYVPSTIRRKEYICELHGEEETFWQSNWMSCKYWQEPEAKPKKRKIRKTKLKQETTGQIRMEFA